MHFSTYQHSTIIFLLFHFYKQIRIASTTQACLTSTLMPVSDSEKGVLRKLPKTEYYSHLHRHNIQTKWFFSVFIFMIVLI